MLIFCIHILLNSVAMQLMRDVIFNGHIVASFARV